MTILLVESSGTLDLGDLSLGGGVLPRVEIVLIGAALPVGVTCEVRGTTADGFTWHPRGGRSFVGTGQQVILTDVLAPLNVVLTYTLYVAGESIWSESITRTHSGRGGDGAANDVISSLSGSVVAEVRRLPGDDRQSERRVHVSRVAGNPWSPVRLDPTSGRGSFGMSLASVGAATRSLRAWDGSGMLDGSDPLIYFHDTSRCVIPGCSVPPVQIGVPVSERSNVGERVDIGERVWDLSFLACEDPEPDLVVPFQTWADLDAAGLTWAGLDALGLTWGEFDATTWSEVGA